MTRPAMTATAPQRRGPTVRIFIPGALRNYANGRVHWRTEAAYRKRWRLAVGLVARPVGLAALATEPKHIHLDAQTFNRFDADGLANACKPILDGLVDAGVLHSDGPSSGHLVTYAQAINRKERGVRITITPVAP
jgi:hypothetical protein